MDLAFNWTSNPLIHYTGTNLHLTKKSLVIGDHLLIWFTIGSKSHLDPGNHLKRDWRNHSSMKLLNKVKVVEWDSSMDTSGSFFTACMAFLLYLDDVTNAYWEKRGLVISDWYFGEGMENNSTGQKVKKCFLSFFYFLNSKGVGVICCNWVLFTLYDSSNIQALIYRLYCIMSMVIMPSSTREKSVEKAQ